MRRARPLGLKALEACSLISFVLVVYSPALHDHVAL